MMTQIEERPPLIPAQGLQAELPISRFNIIVGLFIVISIVWTIGTVFGLLTLAREVNAGHMAAAATSLPFYFGMGLLFALAGLAIFMVCLWMLCGRQRVLVEQGQIQIENRLFGHTFNRRSVDPAEINRVEADLNTSDQWWVKLYMHQVGYIIALGGGLNEEEAQQLKQQLKALLPTTAV